MGTNIPHTCIPGLVWRKQARRFSQFELKVGALGFPIHFVCVSAALERLGESGATHDSQSASRSGVEAWVARNLNGWDDSDAGLSQG